MLFPSDPQHEKPLTQSDSGLPVMPILNLLNRTNLMAVLAHHFASTASLCGVWTLLSLLAAANTNILKNYRMPLPPLHTEAHFGHRCAGPAPSRFQLVSSSQSYKLWQQGQECISVTPI
jgi:hypothetical protein